MTPIPLSLYIHFPWCIQKCPYCDFNSHEVRGELPEKAYIDALIQNIQQELPNIWGRRLESVFIGGGTPSLISAEGMATLFSALRSLLPMRPEMEITLEANPGTFEQDRFSQYREIGINRLSVGIQSYDAGQLKQLGRVHNADEALRASDIARKAGFDNLNLDLMFGLPNQSEDEALSDLQQAIDCQPDHLSWYQLTIEPNTYFHTYPPKLPEGDAIADFQEKGVQLLQDSGYQQYEVSAYAQTNRQCRHNRNYWEFGDYLAIGAGGHGKLTNMQFGTIERYFNYKQPAAYMDACSKGAVRSKTESLSEESLPFEFMLNALRLKQGFDKTLFEQRTLLSPESIESLCEQAVTKDLLREEAGHLRASDLGWKFLNELTEMFLPQ